MSEVRKKEESSVTLRLLTLNFFLSNLLRRLRETQKSFDLEYIKVGVLARHLQRVVTWGAVDRVWSSREK